MNALLIVLLILNIHVESAVQKVLPGSSFTITYSVSINVGANAVLVLNHTSDGYTFRNVTIDFFKGYETLNGHEKKNYFANDPGLTLYQTNKVSNVYTFSKTFTAPMLEGLLWPRYTLHRVNHTEDLLGYELNDTIIDISCSDGIYCNGLERLIRGMCKRPTIPPCQSISNAPCTSYQCNETLQRCNREPIGDCSSLPSCNSEGGTCVPDCVDKLCGPDGCGGYCGTCTSGNWCIEGACDNAPPLGSCAIPKQLLNTTDGVVPLTGLHDLFIYGDSRDGVDMVTPICNYDNIVEYVYKFTIPTQAVNGMGFEIRVTCADGTTGCDTALAIHDANCGQFDLTSVDRLCSDDESPPGGLGSRVDGKLQPGNYTLIVTSWSAEYAGPYKLQIKFTLGCYPKCDNKYCGGDDCGGTCGLCQNGTVCYFGKCRAEPCVPDCKKRSCGSDGCGDLCGSCKKNGVCDDKVGKCIAVKECDNFVPKCENMQQGMGLKKFCGSDCKWHDLESPAPDLVVNTYEEMIPSVNFFWSEFNEESCALSEGCIGGTGNRLLMNFATHVHNIGSGDLIAPPVHKNPHLFTWASCHQHYHYENFARFSLYNITTNKPVVLGGKQSFCIVDDQQYLNGPSIQCDQTFQCDSQGIMRGRSDLYVQHLDCQWLDITDKVKLGCWHIYEVCANVGRSIYESSYENNCIKFPLYIPTINSSMSTTLSYASAVAKDNANSFYPGCKS